MTTQMTILGGCSKFDLMLALFDHGVANSRVALFTLETGDNTSQVAQVFITGVDIEDGSGDSWIFRGILRRLGRDRNFGPAARNVHGYFHTGTRKGWMKFVEETQSSAPVLMSTCSNPGG